MQQCCWILESDCLEGVAHFSVAAANNSAGLYEHTSSKAHNKQIKIILKKKMYYYMIRLLYYIIIHYNNHTFAHSQLG